MVERIRTLLESRQLTPTQFADLIGVARPIISHILSGRNKPSLDVVQRILAAMPDLSMAWLLNGTEPMLTGAPQTAPVATAPQPVVAPILPEPANTLPLATTAAEVPAPVLPARSLATVHKFAKQPITPPVSVAEMSLPLAAPPTSTAALGGPSAAQPVPAAPRPLLPRRFPIKQAAVGQSETSPGAMSAVPPTPSVAGNDVVPFVNSVPGDSATASSAAIAANEQIAEARPAQAPAAPVEHAQASALATPVVAAQPGASTSAGMNSAGPPASAAPTLANDMASALFTGAEKPIRRIVIFYRDGSFADYQPE